jgi:hypothetical protein
MYVGTHVYVCACMYLTLLNDVYTTSQVIQEYRVA